jgi:uncharacterized protein YjeT (DUF2065 family)
MSNIIIAEWFCASLLVVIGLSHIAAPRLWATLFKDLFKLPYAGLVIGCMTLPIGLALILLHNVWTPSVGLIVTIIAWAWTVKGALYLILPGLPARVGAPHMERPIRFAWAGGVMVVLGAVVMARLVLLVVRPVSVA